MATDPSIPVGGPVDPTVAPQSVEDVNRPAWFTLMAPGWWPPDEQVTQAYGFCFTPDGGVVLVDLDGFGWTLPGGPLEPGESAQTALVREVAEEACARVTDAVYLACQHVWDPQAPTGPASYYQTRWWARVELERWEPRHETVDRTVVAPDRVLATLAWSNTQIAGRLLDLARTVDASRRR
jgi:ADP-ribose pyrophosphatase YjhB (NUDIX family)